MKIRPKVIAPISSGCCSRLLTMAAADAAWHRCPQNGSIKKKLEGFFLMSKKDLKNEIMKFEWKLLILLCSDCCFLCSCLMVAQVFET